MHVDRLGVFVHDSPADDAALAYAGRLAALAPTAGIYCVHVRESDEAPEPELVSLTERVQRRLPADVAARARVEIVPHRGTLEMLRAIRSHDLDLMIIGRRLPSENVGISAAVTRLARKAPCSVLVVPRYAQPRIGRILVGVDFSEHARHAVQTSLVLARASGEARPEVLLLHNEVIGYGYGRTGLTLTEAIAQRELVMNSKLREFVHDLDTQGVALDFQVTTADVTEAALHEFAVARRMDLLVVGSRGAESMFVLGSISERLLHISLLPLLIVKQKGETYGLLEALAAAAAPAG